jgi:plastocyanin
MSDRHAMTTQSRRLRRRRAFFLVVGFLWATPVLSDAALAENPLVTIDQFAFSPPSLTVMVGMSVTWLNKDDIPHTVVSKTRQFKSKALDTDDSFSFTFNEAGTYEYFCSLHPHMTGTIVVDLASRAAR